jgi:hypothetical protein
MQEHIALHYLQLVVVEIRRLNCRAVRKGWIFTVALKYLSDIEVKLSDPSTSHSPIPAMSREYVDNALSCLLSYHCTLKRDKGSPPCNMYHARVEELVASSRGNGMLIGAGSQGVAFVLPSMSTVAAEIKAFFELYDRHGSRNSWSIDVEGIRWDSAFV